MTENRAELVRLCDEMIAWSEGKWDKAPVNIIARALRTRLQHDAAGLTEEVAQIIADDMGEVGSGAISHETLTTAAAIVRRIIDRLTGLERTGGEDELRAEIDAARPEFREMIRQDLSGGTMHHDQGYAGLPSAEALRSIISEKVLGHPYDALYAGKQAALRDRYLKHDGNYPFQSDVDEAVQAVLSLLRSRV